MRVLLLDSEKSPARPFASAGEAPGDKPEEIVRALGTLLGRYIDLLEGHDHGGWTREEGALVQDVCSLLERTCRETSTLCGHLCPLKAGRLWGQARHEALRFAYGAG